MFLALFVFTIKLAHSQERKSGFGVWGLGVSQGTFKIEYLSLQNNLIGGTVFFEPQASILNLKSRFELNYGRRIGDTLAKSNNISSYFNIKTMLGKILNQGKRIQFPIYAGFSYNSTNGGLASAGWGLTAKTGLRIFVTKKISVFGEAGYDTMLYPDIKLKYSSGKEETVSLYPTNLNLNVGILFSNFSTDNQ